MADSDRQQAGVKARVGDGGGEKRAGLTSACSLDPGLSADSQNQSLAHFPSTLAGGAVNGGGPIPSTTSTTTSASVSGGSWKTLRMESDRLAVSTSSLEHGVSGTDAVASVTSGRAASSVSVSGKGSNPRVAAGDGGTDTAPSSSTEAAADQAAEADLGDNPNKVLQAVRSTTLPFPLPVPIYTQAVHAARASGNVLTERATIIRETVKFFLNFKYWWTSEDYDRIAELVVNEFPELRDPILWPSAPCYSKVRLDLSMCARNIRRIAKNQKRRASPARSGGGGGGGVSVGTEGGGGAAGDRSLELNPKSMPTSAPAPVTVPVTVPTPTPTPTPAPKARKSSGKGRKSGSQMLLTSPTMVSIQPAGQMLPHTAHTAQSTVAASSTASAMEQKDSPMSSLSYMLTSTASVTPASTVLPPVAHFLGHSSTPAHTSTGGIVFPSLLPATMTLTSNEPATQVTNTVPTHAPSIPQPRESGMAASAPSEVRGEGRGSAESYLGAGGSLSAAWRPDAQLPDPLPVPPYSEKVMKAKKMGVTKYERPLIIRETVLFFLSLKYWWSSGDYDRISDFLVAYFPDLKEPPLLSSSLLPNRRVRTDLSQTARNIRRREVMLRRRDSLSPEQKFQPVGTVSMPIQHSVQQHHQQQQQQPSTDFCNELLAAASIIESRTAALHQNDVAQALQLHAEATRQQEANPGVIMHTQGAKDKDGQDDRVPMPVQTSEAGKYPFSYAGGAVATESSAEGSVVPASEGAVVKQEVGEGGGEGGLALEQFQALQAQASQAWLSAHMSQALSMQALSGLGAHMSQALSAAHISELYSQTSPSSPPATHTPATGKANPPAAHQSSSGVAGSDQRQGSSPSSAAVTLQQQLSQAGGSYALPTVSSSPGEGGAIGDSTTVDRMSAMAMWRSTCLPDPLPVPQYSINVLRARDSGNTASARPRIIRETTQFFLSMKMWWTTQDYERIAEMVLTQFPALKTVQNIKKDLGTCARNMRRRLPLSRSKQAWGAGVGSQSPLKDDADSASLTLGELATMASLRDAQDKGRATAESSGLASLTEEQRQALLAHSVYDPNALAWSALYQHQFSAPADTAPAVSQGRGAGKRGGVGSGGDASSVSKGLEMAERDLAEVLKLAGLEQSVKQMADAESSRRLSAEVGEEVKVTKELKRESSGKAGHRTGSSEGSKGDSHPKIKELISHPPLMAKDPSPKVSVSMETPQFHMTEGGLIHAHPTPVRAHSQPISQLRPDPGASEEVPMNLTCGSEVAKEHKPVKVKTESKVKVSKEELDAFSARDQVWFPHGSPWKKSAPNVFKALPTPLPVPKYSSKLVKAHEEGLAYRHRSEIIRETARFFLGFKYWWSSADYSRISELVVLQFPELKDPVAQHGQPCYRRVQRDLSMCARNLRRKNTRRQHVTSPDGSYAPLPKKPKGGGGGEGRKKGRKDIKKEGGASVDTKDLIGADQALQSQVMAAIAAATPLTHNALDQSTGDLGSLPSITCSSTLPAPSGGHWGVSLGDGVPAVSGGPVFPTFAASFPPSSSPSVPVAQTSRPPPARQQKKGSKQAAGGGMSKLSSGKAVVKTEPGALPQTQPTAKSATAKSAKSVAPSAHKKDPQQPKGQPSSGSQVKGGGKGGKDGGRRAQLQSRPGHSEARTSSNTTAIVSPTVSVMYSAAETRDAEGRVSDKVYINPEHGSELQTQLTKLWQDGKFFDASLEVDDYRLPVHKLVLLAASPYLQSTFRHANPTSHLEVNLPRDTGIGAARDFLKYIYEGVLHVAPETVSALRRIAAMLQIDHLLSYCDDYISRLTGTPATPSHSHRTPLARNSSQVPRVSVNLRDGAHGHHSLGADPSSLTSTAGGVLEMSNGHGTSLPAGGGAYPQGPGSASRKRTREEEVAAASTTGLQYLPAYGVEGGQGGTRCASESDRQDPVPASTEPPKRARLSKDPERGDPPVTLDQRSGAGYSAVVSGSQQLPPGDEEAVSSLPHAALLQHLSADKAGRGASSSVIQRGPNAVGALMQLSQSSHNAEEHEVVVRFLAESAVSGGEDPSLSASSGLQHHPHHHHHHHLHHHQQSHEDEEVTLLPQSEVEVEVDGDSVRVVGDDSPHLATGAMGGDSNLLPLQDDGQVAMQVGGEEEVAMMEEEEGGEVVVEGVVLEEGGDLLQDVDVAACETVECSLLPQTYRSSPEDEDDDEAEEEAEEAEALQLHGPPSSSSRPTPHSALQTMASQWAAQQYAQAPLDAATAQQFAAVLHDRRYGHAGSPATVATHARSQHQQSDAYGDGGYSASSHRPQGSASQETSSSTVAGGDEGQADQTSLLPQTYCSSPPPHSPSVSAH